ncbi:hypothetical protein V1521DRAFT_442289 [Lipomyces starkeyi]
MEEVCKSGKVKAIGVANWAIPYLEELRKKWTVVPAVNQVELHPFLNQHDLKSTATSSAFCSKRILLLAPPRLRLCPIRKASVEEKVFC